jgi:hypothetical protein
VGQPFIFTLSTKEKKDLFEAADTRTGLPAFVIEKDYYVTLVLKLLFEDLKPQHTEHTPTPFMFKGGTTLSKVYRCIRRMSEDIDLSLDMKFLGYPEPAERESRKALEDRVKALNSATQERVKNTLAPFLEKSLSDINPGFTVKVLDNGTDIEVFYPKVTQAPDESYVKQRVLLECGGKAGLEPSSTHEISPIALEEMDVYGDNCKVDVLGCDRTFFEKLTALHEINHRGVDKLGERQSRHIYDIVSINEKFPQYLANRDLLEKVVEHKKKYFRRGAAKWNEAVPGSLWLTPEGDVAKALEDDWGQMDIMFPEGTPASFEDMLEQLREIESVIND